MLRSLLREGRRFPLAVGVSMLVAALTAVPALAVVQEAGNGPRLEGLKRLDLPQRIARAADVRWFGDGTVLIGVIGLGVHAWRIGESGVRLRVALEEPEAEVRETEGRRFIGPSRERDYGRLAVSPQGIAFADLFAGIHVANERGIIGPLDMEFVGDLDRRRSRTAAVGLMRADADSWAPYVAWLIEDAGGPPRGLLPTRDGGRALEVCSDAELSVIRFIANDRLLVIPGAESGVFVYDGEGGLRDSVDAATFFAESGCDVEPNEWGNSPLSDAYWRADWLGPRRMIDDVVADGGGNVYFFVRYGANPPAEEPDADVGVLPVPARRAFAADITATLANTDPACPVPACYEPASPGLTPVTSAYHWRPAPAWRAENSPRRRSIHHVALRSAAGATSTGHRESGLAEAQRQQPPGGRSQPWRREDVDRIRAGNVEDLVVASVPPPSGRVCWDLIHARVDDLRTVAMRPCVIESEYADTRLRADLRGDRVVILLRGGALRGGDVRAAEAFEARIRPPAGSGD